MAAYDHGNCKVYNFLDDLDPEVKRRLAKTEPYQRFVFERARLESMAIREYAKSGSLSAPDIVALNDEVEALGQAVLREIEDIRFLLCEPSFREFCALLGGTPAAN